jgi:hypothetical protein
MADPLSPVRPGLTAGDFDSSDETGCDHGQPAGESRALDTGQRPHAFEHAIVELDAL